MCDERIRYETILRELRRDIVMGKYPVGTRVKSVKKICEENNVGVVTGYKIHNLLAEEGFVKYVPELKGSVVIPFDNEYWKVRVNEEAVDELKKALAICKTVKLPKDMVATVIQEVYPIQRPPIRE